MVVLIIITIFPKDFDVLPPLSNGCLLQQLYIVSNISLSDEFVNTLTAHGSLECVILHIRSITINGITTLINNSPNLSLLQIYFKMPFFDDTYSYRLTY